MDLQLKKHQTKRIFLGGKECQIKGENPKRNSTLQNNEVKRFFQEKVCQNKGETPKRNFILRNNQVQGVFFSFEEKGCQMKGKLPLHPTKKKKCQIKKYINI